MARREYVNPHVHRKSFYRVLFGNPWDSNIGANSLLLDLTLLMVSPIELENPKPFIIFGKDNMSKMVDLGFACILADNNPNMFGKEKWYCHKLLAFELAMKMFDEAVFLDIDCCQDAPLPEDFWQSYSQGGIIRAPAYKKKTHIATWRRRDGGIIPCACYIYTRGPEIADLIIGKLNHFLKHPWKHRLDCGDETVLAGVIDELNGGWKGLDDYVEKYEPWHCHRWDRARSSIMPDPVFNHMTFASRSARRVQRAGVNIDWNDPKKAFAAMLKLRIDDISRRLKDNPI